MTPSRTSPPRAGFPPGSRPAAVGGRQHRLGAETETATAATPTTHPPEAGAMVFSAHERT